MHANKELYNNKPNGRLRTAFLVSLLPEGKNSVISGLQYPTSSHHFGPQVDLRMHSWNLKTTTSPLGPSDNVALVAYLLNSLFTKLSVLGLFHVSFLSFKGHFGSWQHDANPRGLWYGSQQVPDHGFYRSWEPSALEQHWDVLFWQKEIRGGKSVAFLLLVSHAPCTFR